MIVRFILVVMIYIVLHAILIAALNMVQMPKEYQLFVVIPFALLVPRLMVKNLVDHSTESSNE